MMPRAGLVTFCFLVAGAATAQEGFVRYAAPETFTYEELAAMSRNQSLGAELEAKIRTITTTPFVSNEAYYRGAKPHRPVVHHLGPSLRLAFWNIERGVRLDDIKLLFTDREAFIRRIATERYEKKHPGGEIPESELELEADAGQNYALLRAQVMMLASADVITLNEVDWGMPRTQYREVIRELGEALDMNWAYGVEFLEIDPLVVGTEGFENVRDPKERQKLIEAHTPEKDRLKALHGSAILSRYPIRSAKLVPFEAGYDWLSGEEKLPIPERILRGLAGALGDPLHREMRRGWRMSLYAELSVPDLPKGKLTVVTPHLENRAKPDIRKKQLAQVLEEIHPIDHPVVIASDFNTTGTDFSPKSFTGLLKQALLSQDMTPELAAVFASPIGLQYSALHFGVQIAHNQADPTVSGIPILAPNYEQPLFQMVEEFRFADGRSFDLRGDPERTHDGVHSGTLGNSNDRADKGFEPTFETGTMGFLGQYKLDWILVKSYAGGPFDPAAPYRFAPHGSWVLKLVNYAPLERLSDHSPMVVTLPFDEPDVRRRARREATRDLPAWALERQKQLASEREKAEPETDLSNIALGEYRCSDHLALMEDSPGAASVRTIWALGYHYGKSGLDETWPSLTYDKVVRFAERLQTLCQQSPEVLWFKIVRELPPERARGAISTFFDLRPGTYTCRQHVDLASAENQLADSRAVWADGYDAVHRGIDETSPPVTAEHLFAYAQSILERCRMNPDELWIRVVRNDAVRAKAAEFGLTWRELENASYQGILGSSIALRDGVYEASDRRVQLAPDFRMSGHLHGDGLEEAVVLLTETREGEETGTYLAVVSDENGAVNRGTALIGRGVQVMDGRIADGGIELDVVEPGPGDRACCPSQKVTHRWKVGSNGLREEAPAVMGTLSLADLEGSDWILTHFDRGEPAPRDPKASLSVQGNRLAGKGGCNQYFAELTGGEEAGALEIGPIGATRMACPGEASDVEARFLRQLEGVTRFGFVAGKLALTTKVDDADRTMLFVRAH